MRKFYYLATCLMFIIMTMSNAAIAQDIRENKRISDSIITVFNTALNSVNYVKTELIANPNDFYLDENKEINGDTVWLENYENYRFYRTKESGDKKVAEYFTGKIGNLFECEKTIYFFYKGKLVMTQQLFVSHGDALDDYGVNLFLEEKRIIFSQTNGTAPIYITRDFEGANNLTDIRNVAFKQLDVRRIIYDKNVFETIGLKIYNHETDL